jgi:hypothetical protein
MVNKDFQNGFIAGAVSGGVVEVEVDVSKPEQEKIVTITENGTTEVTPDDNKTLSKVTVVAEFEGGTEEIKNLIDNSGVLEENEYTLTQKVQKLIDLIKEYQNDNPESAVPENILKSLEGYLLKDKDGLCLTTKESR